MATRTPSPRSRSTAAKRAPRKQASRAAPNRVQALTANAETAVRAVRTRATRAARKLPTDRTSLSIAFGVMAGLAAAGVAIFMNRDRLRSAATASGEKLRTAAHTGSEKLKKAADDLSSMAHERIDQARDNITRIRSRANGGDARPAGSANDMAITG